jgi:hypothetical protein
VSDIDGDNDSAILVVLANAENSTQNDFVDERLSEAPSTVPSTPSQPSVTSLPSSEPSDVPTGSNSPSTRPSSLPTGSSVPSVHPTSLPSVGELPSAQPSLNPSQLPSSTLSESPSTGFGPSDIPSQNPSLRNTPDSNAPSDTRPPSQVTFAPSATFGPTQDCARRIVIDFETAGNGTGLNRGDYVADDWFVAYGLSISAFATMGGYVPGNKARIFDTSNPGTSQLDGDPDLGSPHRYV